MTVTGPPALSPARPRTWWDRNWKWFLPVAGFGALAMMAAFGAAIVLGVLGLLKSSDAYRMSLAEAIASAEVQEELGTPVTAGLFVTGQIKLENSNGRASLSIPIRGPKGKGTITVRATKENGRWTFAQVVVTFAASDRQIDLTSATNQAGADQTLER